MRIHGARVFSPEGGFSVRDIGIRGDRLVPPEGACGPVINAAGCYAIPGLVDIHTHGCVRHDYSTAGPEGIGEMTAWAALNGVTALCATTLTLPEADLVRACSLLSSPAGAGCADIVGIHLEGPFVSPDKLGAQNPAHVQGPDGALFHRLQHAAGGKVKILSLAPERPGALELIGALGGEVVCSLAHTTADYETGVAAFSRGARHLTHIYNAMPPFSHRAPGVIGAALDTPWAMVELICDNIHVHPSVVRATLSMFGPDRVIFVSDSMMATGLEDGEYDLGGQAVQVRGSTARLLRDGAIAGSVTDLMGCLRTAVRVAGVPLETAVACASVNPAKAIGEFHRRGSLDPGKTADLVLLEEDLSIRQVYLRGDPIR